MAGKDNKRSKKSARSGGKGRRGSAKKRSAAKEQRVTKRVVKKKAAKKAGRSDDASTPNTGAPYTGPRHTNLPPALASATVRNVRIAPRKARLVIDMLRGKQVEPALQALRFNPKKGAKIVEKLLKSAISNAQERISADVDKLWVTGGFVDSGRNLKRLMPRAQGRGDIISKKSSHITIFLGERK